MKIEPPPDPWTPSSLNSRQDGPDWQSELFENFKSDAVLQITERGCPVAEVAVRQGTGTYSPCEWRKLHAKPAVVRDDEQAAQVRRTRDEARTDGFDTI